MRVDAAIALSDVAVASGRDLTPVLEALADELGGEHALRLDAQLALGRWMHGRIPERLTARLARADMLPDDSPAGCTLLAAAAHELAATCAPADEAVALAERALAGNLGAGHASMLAILTLLAVDRLEEAFALLDRAVTDAQETGAVLAFCIGSLFRSTAQLRLGRVREAEADARASLAALEDWPGRTEAAAVLVAPLRERGALEEAQTILDGIEHWPPNFATATLLEQRARVRLESGQAEDAYADFVAAGEIALRWGVRSPTMLHWRSGAALALGEGEEAVRLATEELALARAARTPRAEGVARHTLGLVGPPRERIAHLEAAVALTAGARLEHARALVDLGAAHHRAGGRTKARSVLEQGLDLAHRCGASALEQRARDALIRAGARPRRALLSGVEALTASERRTVEMAAANLTNRDIARALFVAPKTVEAHLTRAYAKLGVRGREELARALRDGDR